MPALQVGGVLCVVKAAKEAEGAGDALRPRARLHMIITVVTLNRILARNRVEVMLQIFLHVLDLLALRLDVLTGGLVVVSQLLVYKESLEGVGARSHGQLIAWLEPSVDVCREPGIFIKQFTGALFSHHKVLERCRADAKTIARLHPVQLLVGLRFGRCVVS